VGDRVLTLTTEVASCDLVDRNIILVTHATRGRERILDEGEVVSDEEGWGSGSEEIGGDVGKDKERVSVGWERGGQGSEDFVPAMEEYIVDEHIVDDDLVDGAAGDLRQRN
jgi:hypothetical protein